MAPAIRFVSLDFPNLSPRVRFAWSTQLSQLTSFVPHPSQKFASSSFKAAHVGQATFEENGFPQLSQKLAE